jgi:hypothetical protein
MRTLREYDRKVLLIAPRRTWLVAAAGILVVGADVVAVMLAQLSQLAEFEGQNPFVFKGGIEKVFTTERARERAGRAGWR